MTDHIVKCRFNLFQEGRTYTGHHRNYVLESAKATCYAPETRERLRLRELVGYFGHGRRHLAQKLKIGEVEAIKLPDGTAIVVDNIPSNVMSAFEVDKDGNVDHTQEFLIEADPGKMAFGLHKSKVGGFSWATGGIDGGALGVTRINRIEGFDYVIDPGFSENRGYILESANVAGRDLIFENIVKMGIDEKSVESALRSWVASAQLRAMELEERIAEAAVFESALIDERDAVVSERDALRAEFDKIKADRDARRKMIMECADRSIFAIPDTVKESLISMADEKDFHNLVAFFESAARVNLDGLPLPGRRHEQRIVPIHAAMSKNPEYGDPDAATDFGGPFRI